MKTTLAGLLQRTPLIYTVGLMAALSASASAQFTLPPFPASPAPVVMPGQTVSGGFGRSVSRIGDLNGDGVMDIVVGAPTDDHPVSGLPTGGAYIRSGANGSIINLSGLGAQGGVHGTTTTGDFGWSVAGLDDLNGDSFADLAVGAPLDGTVSVFSGNGGGLLYNLAIPTMGNWFAGQPGHFPIVPNQVGFSVADAGDVNADGVRDIIIGGPSTTTYNPFTNPPSVIGGGGMAVIYDGATGANIMQVASNGDFTGLYGTSQDENFGWAVGAAGDWDGDGFDDVIVGSPNHSNGKGKVTVYSGRWISTVNNTTPPPIPPTIMSYGGSTTYPYVGIDVANGGDMTGDGVDEIVVGHWGGAYVYVGGSTPLTPGIQAHILSTSLTGYQMVASGEDLNGDGVPDLVMGPDGINGVLTAKAVAYNGISSAPMFNVVSGLRSGVVASMVLLPDSTGNGKAEIVMGQPDAKVGGQVKGQASLILR